MKKFMDADFLLETETAKKLYHDYAEKMPIIDYHCHLLPQQIAEDKRYETITDVWLDRDHYKWRAMRIFGVEEKYITGDASPKEKFFKWAEAMPYCIGNPLYHWTHLELQRYFGIYEPLSAKTAESIWNRCNEILKGADFSARGLIKRSNVEIICTTDDPIDSLEYHEQIANDKSFDVKVLPSFRPDKALNITRGEFCGYIKALGEVVGYEISSFDALKKALDSRLDFFAAHGCKVSDHALDTVEYAEPNEDVANAVLLKALAGETLTENEIATYRTTLFLHFARGYAERNIAMQIHIGALRDNNSDMFTKLGPDTGFDAICDNSVTATLGKLLDALEREDKLPKTVLYSLNQYHNEALITLAGCFAGHGIAGKVQLGSAWWFNDHIEGMTRQMTAFGNLSLLSKFVGMLTDSRSFLSYTRHEYFRRILCNLIGNWVENGEVYCDMEALGKIVCDISYNNTKNFLFK